jgi:hypothetical protein
MATTLALLALTSIFGRSHAIQHPHLVLDSDEQSLSSFHKLKELAATLKAVFVEMRDHEIQAIVS